MFLVQWFYTLVNKVFGYKKPSKVKRFRAELIDMSNVRVTWALPTVSPRQKAIQHTEISIRVSDTLPWTVQDVVAPDVSQELVFVDVFPGMHYYQAVVVDVDGVRGNPVETSADVPFDPPGTVTTLTATIE